MRHPIAVAFRIARQLQRRAQAIDMPRKAPSITGAPGRIEPRHVRAHGDDQAARPAIIAVPRGQITIDQ